MKRILISGYHGFWNCGDEAILVAMVNNLKSVYPDLQIVALSKRPKDTSKIYGIKSINRVNIFKIIGQMLRTNLLLSGGGSLLQDVTSTRSLIYYLGIIALAKLLGKPVMIYANGIGPIKKGINRLLTRLIVNRVDIITLRDDESRSELMRLGVKKPEVIVTADPVFTLEAVNTKKADEILKKEGVDISQPLIGISVRKWKSGSNYEQIIAEAADDIIRKYDCNVLFIPMQMPNDLGIIEKIQALMKNKSYSIKGKYSVQEYMSIIGKMRLLISMRLHTLIFAAVQKVPMIGIVYDPKVQSFLNLIQQPSAGDISSLDSEKLYALIEEILNNRKLVCLKIEKYIDDLRKRARLNDSIVIRLLRNQK